MSSADEILSVRRAQSEDAAAIAALARALALHVCDPDLGEDAAAVEKFCLSDRAWCECHVAEIDGEVVGYASVSRRYDPHAQEPSLWLSDLIVASDFRGRGVGHALTKAVCDRAAEVGAGSVYFEVWKENASALEFYHRIGCEILSDRILMRLIVRGGTGSSTGGEASQA